MFTALIWLAWHSTSMGNLPAAPVIGQRYGEAAMSAAPPSARNSDDLQLLRHPDGEVQLRFTNGYRMEARVQRTSSGELLIQCSDPGHSRAPHRHDASGAEQ